jgi:hypothetical protein
LDTWNLGDLDGTRIAVESNAHEPDTLLSREVSSHAEKYVVPDVAAKATRIHDDVVPALVTWVEQ